MSLLLPTLPDLCLLETVDNGREFIPTSPWWLNLLIALPVFLTSLLVRKPLERLDLLLGRDVDFLRVSSELVLVGE